MSRPRPQEQDDRGEMRKQRPQGQRCSSQPQTEAFLRVSGQREGSERQNPQKQQKMIASQVSYLFIRHNFLLWV